MHFSTLISSLLGLAGLAVSSPITKRGFNIGKLSPSPPPNNFGVGQFGSFNQFSLGQVSDVDILQFALMLEVCRSVEKSDP